MKIEFPLHFDPEHFREIYFQDDQGSYLKSATVKRPLRIFLIIVIVWGIAVAIMLYNGNDAFFKLASVAFIFGLAYYLHAARALYRWKKQVNQFLERENAFKHYQLILTQESFSLIQDETQHIEKWSEMKAADIQPNYVTIMGRQDYVIPLKSIGKEPFEILKKTVAKKLK